MNKLTSILFCLILCSSVGYAQDLHRERKEFQENTITYYGCIPFGTDGMLLKTLDETTQTSGKIDIYTYVKYDTAFQIVNTTNVTLPARKANYIDYTNSENHYSLAFQTSGAYTLTIINAQTLATKTIQGKLPKNTMIQSIRAVGDYVYFQGFTKELPILIAQNIQTEELIFGKIIPLSKRNFSIISFEINEESGEAYLFTKDALKNDRLIKFYIYKDGQKTFETIVKSNEPDKYIVSAFASRLHDNSYLLSGTYGNTSRNTATSVGIYISKIATNGTIEFTKYINYLDINNFTSYLSEKRQEKIEKKQERLNNRSKELEINYLMIPHKIIEENNTYALVGEAFYPTFRQECQHISAPGGPTMHCYQVFDGYQYTHFFLLGFNANGELLWSNSAPMYINDKPYTPLRYLSINKESQNLKLVYSSWDKLYLHTYQSGEETQAENFPYINADEKLLLSTCRNRYWYGNTFLSFGNQKIKNKEEHNKRDIFFIEKLNIPTK